MTVFQMVLIAALYALINVTFMCTLQMQMLAFNCGFLCGLILGDWKTGLMLGAAIQTLNMAPVTTGATINYDLTTATFIAVPLAMSAGLEAEMALTLAIPFAVLGVFLTPLEKTINSAIAVVADKAAAKGNEKGIGFAAFVMPFINVPVRFLCVFLVLFFGSAAIEPIFAAIPEWVMNGLTVMAGLLPALGFALFLNILGKKSLLPYFFLGFYISYCFGLSTIIMAIFGVVLAFLHETFTKTAQAY